MRSLRKRSLRSYVVIATLFLGMQSANAGLLCALTKDPTVCEIGQGMRQAGASLQGIDRPPQAPQAQSCERYVCQQFRSGQVECRCQ